MVCPAGKCTGARGNTLLSGEDLKLKWQDNAILSRTGALQKHYKIIVYIYFVCSINLQQIVIFTVVWQ